MNNLLLSIVDHQGIPSTDQQIKDEALTFVLAGNLMLSYLSSMQEDIDGILPNGTEPTNKYFTTLVPFSERKGYRLDENA
ncbi:unnamed protein product [Adineta steineri]|uniref:Uncharacterized protein n=1 Tax=Adineta steineri TaxID=433720 RepID=A0A815EGF9_9BILA|nr:unnamed protein product [Adineta steineri]CAF1311481.1 unnamed protein product [Adineta steineri]